MRRSTTTRCTTASPVGCRSCIATWKCGWSSFRAKRSTSPACRRMRYRRSIEAELLEHVPQAKAMISVVSPPFINSDVVPAGGGTVLARRGADRRPLRQGEIASAEGAQDRRLRTADASTARSTSSRRCSDLSSSSSMPKPAASASLTRPSDRCSSNASSSGFTIWPTTAARS